MVTHLLFRFRVVGGEHLDAAGPRAIFALRHFYEWDPLLTYAAFGLRRALVSGAPPLTITSHLWTKTAPRRAASWLIGILSLIPNHEPGGAIARAGEILGKGRGHRVAICPTGPIGKSRRYRVGSSIGRLAQGCPDVPVVPVSLIGVQELRWSRVLTLRRPGITVICGAPLLMSSQPQAGSATARQKAFGDAIDAAWQALEAPYRPVSEGSVSAAP